MPRPGLSHADRVAGGLIEGAMAVHHRRRLRHLGHATQIDPPDDGLWAAGDPAPRAGNALEILVDGAQALPEIERAIRGARRHVHIAGWSITPHFPVTRDEPPVLLRELLADAAERVPVRVLMWAGAPAHTFAPDRATARAARDELTRGTRVRAACDARSRALHCHHE
jgi:phosphatidylserine/phosphatidylglycerophosphate/cardiolipin synthase-like enzyme